MKKLRALKRGDLANLLGASGAISGVVTAFAYNGFVGGAVLAVLCVATGWLVDE